MSSVLQGLICPTFGWIDIACDMAWFGVCVCVYVLACGTKKKNEF